MTVCRPILTTDKVNTSTVCTVHNELEYSTYAAFFAYLLTDVVANYYTLLENK